MGLVPRALSVFRAWQQVFLVCVCARVSGGREAAAVTIGIHISPPLTWVLNTMFLRHVVVKCVVFDMGGCFGATK